MAQRSSSVIKAVLIDITGVLYESGSGCAIPGSIDAVRRLRDSKIAFKFVTNETQNTRSGLVAKLASYGYSPDLVSSEDIHAPAPATREYLEKHGLRRPMLLVHPDVRPEFEGLLPATGGEDADVVVMGDAAEGFSYENLNNVFRTLMTMKNPKLISMGFGKYYKEKGKLVLDVGAYAVGMKHATGVEPIIIGKPDARYFETSLRSLGVQASEAAMIGDDIVSDVGAAQALGLTGILVRTGKFRVGRDDQHPTVKPDAIVDNFAAAVDLILQRTSSQPV